MLTKSFFATALVALLAMPVTAAPIKGRQVLDVLNGLGGEVPDEVFASVSGLLGGGAAELLDPQQEASVIPPSTASKRAEDVVENTLQVLANLLSEPQSKRDEDIVDALLQVLGQVEAATPASNIKARQAELLSSGVGDLATLVPGVTQTAAGVVGLVTGNEPNQSGILTGLKA
jgi:hypothetical protein